MKHYVLAVDNLGRDYHNDILVAVFLHKSDAEKYCSVNNYEHAFTFAKIVDNLDSMNLESMYDINWSTPEFEKFISFTGLELADNSIAISMYNKYYNIKEA